MAIHNLCSYFGNIQTPLHPSMFYLYGSRGEKKETSGGWNAQVNAELLILMAKYHHQLKAISSITTARMPSTWRWMVKCIVPGGVWNKNNYEFSLVLGECLIVCKDSGGAQRRVLLSYLAGMAPRCRTFPILEKPIWNGGNIIYYKFT